MTQNCESSLAPNESPKQANVPDIVAEFKRTTDDTQFRILTTDALAGLQLRIEKFHFTSLRVSDKTKIKLNEFQILIIDRANLSELWPFRVSDFIKNGGEKTEKLAFLLPGYSRKLENNGKYNRN